MGIHFYDVDKFFKNNVLKLLYTLFQRNELSWQVLEAAQFCARAILLSGLYVVHFRYIDLTDSTAVKIQGNGISSFNFSFREIFNNF